MSFRDYLIDVGTHLGLKTFLEEYDRLTCAGCRLPIGEEENGFQNPTTKERYHGACWRAKMGLK